MAGRRKVNYEYLSPFRLAVFPAKISKEKLPPFSILVVLKKICEIAII